MGATPTRDYTGRIRPERHGPLRWTAKIGSSRSSPVVAGGLVLALSKRHRGLVAFDASTGERRYVAEIDDFRGSPAASDDLVLIAAGQGVTALALEDGALQWTFETGPARSPAILGDSAVVSTVEGGLFMVDLGEGRQLWEWADAGAPAGLPVVTPAAVLAVAGASLVALDPASGRELWRAPAANDTAPIAASGHEYALTAVDTIAAYDLSDGARAWARGLGRPAVAPPSVAHGAVVVPCRANIDGDASLLALGDAAE